MMGASVVSGIFISGLIVWSLLHYLRRPDVKEQFK